MRGFFLLCNQDKIAVREHLHFLQLCLSAIREIIRSAVKGAQVRHEDTKRSFQNKTFASVGYVGRVGLRTYLYLLILCFTNAVSTWCYKNILPFQLLIANMCILTCILRVYSSGSAVFSYR